MLKSIAERKGYCDYKKCGRICCGYYPCEYLGCDSKCKVNDTKPEVCRLFPFDEKDKPMRMKVFCEYYWERGKVVIGMF